MSKTALITGASRGIGRAIAQELAGEGYNLHLTCHNNINLLKTFCDDLHAEYGITAYAYSEDAGDDESVTALFADIKKSACPDIDVLINNAGIAHFALFQDMSIEDWNRVISTNLSSAYLHARRVIPDMLKAGSGRIINISSVWGRVGASMETAYSVSKGGIDTMTKALARELALSHITVNAIACGLIDTDMNACLSKEDLDAVIEDIPMGRIGTPDEIAGTVSLLLKAPEYLTGQIISVDGGWT